MYSFNVLPLQYSVTMQQSVQFCQFFNPFNTNGLFRSINAHFSILRRYSVTSLSMVSNFMILTATVKSFLRSLPKQTQPVAPFPSTRFNSTMYSPPRFTLEMGFIEYLKIENDDKDYNNLIVELWLNKLVNNMSRPQNQLPPDLFYNITEASKYESNTRIQSIQRQIAERAIQLLNLPSGSFILDVGCGSGLSAQTLQQNDFLWEGIDISRDMLNIANSKQEINGGLWQIDIGQGWKVRPGVFDGAISISTIQWLCVASRKHDNPFKRCCKFFQSLYDSLRIGARAVLQFYPDGKHQLQMITTAAMKSGFTGGLVVDYPNSTKAKKYYLVIEAGVRRNLNIVEVTGKTQENQNNQNKVDEVKLNRGGKNKLIKKRGKRMIKRKEEVVKMKERLRRKGIATKKDTKYTGRRRKPKF